MSNKNTNMKEENEERISYMTEILPDYQRRKRNAITNEQEVTEDTMVNANPDDSNAKSQIKNYFDEFTSNSSIHGFNHFAAPHRHPLERFLIGMFILGGFVCFIYVSVIAWYRYQHDGFITVWNQQQDRIRLVKPSIIICPQNVINETKFPATFKRYGIEDTPEARKFFHLLTNSTFIEIANAVSYQPAPPELWLRILNDLKIEFEYETSFVGEATWILISGSMCLSIGNYINRYSSIEYILANNWTVSKLPILPPDVPYRQIDNKELNDPNYVSTYTYDPNRNIREFVNLNIVAWIEVYDPLEVYRSKGRDHMEGQLIHDSERFYSTIRTRVLATMQGMEHVSQHRRKCGIPIDKGLEMWSIYTFGMCVSEFRSHIVKKECGCYVHFYRRMPGVPICNITQFRCVSKYEQLISESLAYPRPHKICLANCNHILYSGTRIKLESTALKNNTGVDINIIFPLYRYARREQFSFIDFMTAIGCAAGLFLGCSVLSAVEIFYYATLRFYITKHKYNKN